MGEFVSVQQGVVGQVVGQKVAEAKLGGFLETGAIDALSKASKQTLFPAVDACQLDGRHARGAGARRGRADAPGGEIARRRADRERPGACRGVAGDRRLQTSVDTKIDVDDLKAPSAEADDFNEFVTRFRQYTPPIHFIIPPIIGPPGG